MKINTPYIPREYLALKINYCKTGLSKLPKVKVSVRSIRGENILVCTNGSHTYRRQSARGNELYSIAQKRQSLMSELSRLEGIWHSQFNCPVPADCKPHNVIRQINAGFNGIVALDKEYFDSLKNDANPFHREYKLYPFNGIDYRSNPERSIATYYTEHDIPFKYEPEVWIAGLNKPIYPDFVLFFRELNVCKFHEHFGLTNKASYLRDTQIKYDNYTNAGLVPGLDIIFTYDYSDLPFDIRTLDPDINAAIYRSLLL